MNGYQIEARRRAREVVGGLRWQGMTVPPPYARLAGEFEDWCAAVAMRPGWRPTSIRR